MGQSPGKIVADGMDGFPERKSASEAVGAGPDCFASYLGELLPGGTVLLIKDILKALFLPMHIMSGSPHWSIWGLLGVAAYAAVLSRRMQTYRKNFLAVLLLLTYGIHSLISFQQVLNAPFLPDTGIVEAAVRGEKTKTNQMDTDEELLEAI